MHVGCFFHLAQNIFRKVQSAGLQERYQNEEDLSLSIRMIPALAFVPVDKVLQSFEFLQESLSEEIVVDYFEDNYIGRLRRNRRAIPMFDASIWNVHSRVTNDLSRTNNAVEGWNRKMQSGVSCHHPNIWRFLQILKREQSLNNVNVNQLLGGHMPQAPKKKYKDCATRIVNIVADFENRDIKNYIKAIAYNISL